MSLNSLPPHSSANSSPKPSRCHQISRQDFEEHQPAARILERLQRQVEEELRYTDGLLIATDDLIAESKGNFSRDYCGTFNEVEELIVCCPEPSRPETAPCCMPSTSHVPYCAVEIRPQTAAKCESRSAFPEPCQIGTRPPRLEPCVKKQRVAIPLPRTYPSICKSLAETTPVRRKVPGSSCSSKTGVELARPRSQTSKGYFPNEARIRSSDGARNTGRPLDGTRNASRPLDGTREATRPVVRARSVSRPLDEARSASRPLDRARSASRPLDGTREATRPVDGTREATRPLDGTREATRPLDGTREATRPLDGTREATRPLDRTRDDSRPVVRARSASRPLDEARSVSRPLDRARSASRPLDRARSASRPLDGTREATRPVNGTREATRPVDGTREATRPVDGTREATRPVDGTREATRPLDRTRDDSRPVVRARSVSRPVDGTREPTRPLDGTREATRPLDGTREATRPLDGTREVTRPFDEARIVSRPLDRARSASRPLDEARSVNRPPDRARSASRPLDGTRGAGHPLDEGEDTNRSFYQTVNVGRSFHETRDLTPATQKQPFGKESRATSSTTGRGTCKSECKISNGTECTEDTSVPPAKEMIGASSRASSLPKDDTRSKVYEFQGSRGFSYSRKSTVKSSPPNFVSVTTKEVFSQDAESESYHSARSLSISCGRTPLVSACGQTSPTVCDPVSPPSPCSPISPPSPCSRISPSSPFTEDMELTKTDTDSHSQGRHSESPQDFLDRDEKTTAALCHLSQLRKTPSYYRCGINQGTDFLKVCCPKVKDAGKLGGKVVALPKMPSLPPEDIEDLIKCETKDVESAWYLASDEKKTYKKPCPKQQKAQMAIKNIVQAHTTQKCGTPIYSPLEHPDPEDISPEVAAAMMFSQEQGIKMEECPNANISHLFPDQPKPLFPEKLPQGSQEMIEKSAEVPSEGVSDSAYTRTMREKGEEIGAQRSYDVDFAIGQSKREYVLVAQKPQRVNKVQFRGGTPPPWFPGYFYSFPDDEGLKVVSSPTGLFRKAWAHSNPGNMPQNDVIVLE